MAQLTHGTETVEEGATLWRLVINTWAALLDSLRGTLGVGLAVAESGQGGWSPVFNGSNTQFTLPEAYDEGALFLVFTNGLIQPPSTVTRTTPASGVFAMASALQAGSKMIVIYSKVEA